MTVLTGGRGVVLALHHQAIMPKAAVPILVNGGAMTPATVEAYLATRSDATFTHGICRDCSGRAHLAAVRETAIALPPNGRPHHPTAP